MTAWKKYPEDKPMNGQTVLVLIGTVNNEQLAKDAWYAETATYCDGLFYQLIYDDHLGVLRKMPVNETVEGWCFCITPDPTSFMLNL